MEKLARQAKLRKDKFVRNALEFAVCAPRANGSAFSLVKNLCGSLSGPSDLSSNPKYVEIYRRDGRQPIPLLIP